METIKLLDTAFLLPVINGEIFLGQRGTMPYEGFWGPIGGKSDKMKIDHPWNEPHLVEKLGGHLVVGVSDMLAESDGREFLKGTAVREFCEEAFHGKRFPDDFQRRDISDIVKLGYIVDQTQYKGEMCEFHNFVYLARVNRTDFSLSPRELRGLKPLREFSDKDKIYPMGKIALLHIFYSFREGLPGKLEGYENLVDQIRPFVKTGFISVEECRSTSMLGVLLIPDYVRALEAV